MQNLFGRAMRNVCIAVLTMLPTSISAEDFPPFPADTRAITGQVPASGRSWHQRHGPTASPMISFWQGFIPLFTTNMAGLTATSGSSSTVDLNTGGVGSFSPPMGGAGNGNGNGNLGSNNGNGNQTNGNGNFGSGNGFGNGSANTSGFWVPPR